MRYCRSWGIIETVVNADEVDVAEHSLKGLFSEHWVDFDALRRSMGLWSAEHSNQFVLEWADYVCRAPKSGAAS